MRLRALMLVLLSLPLAGCFSHGDDEELMVPTNASIFPPPPTVSTTRPPPPTPNFNDPGYVTTATWHVGDQWDWVAPSRRYHSTRVVASYNASGTTWFVTHEQEGILDSDPNIVFTRWVNATSWTYPNATSSRGLVTTYTPPAPERFLRNGTYRYNATASGSRDSAVANVFYTGRLNVTLPWGEIVRAARFAHYAVLTRNGGETVRQIQTHVFAQEYGNDLSFQLGDDAEVYALASVRYGPAEHGTLVPHRP